MSLEGLSADQLFELGGLKARCNEMLRCVPHGLSLPCELCELEDGLTGDAVCSTCGGHFPLGMSSLKGRDCQSAVEFARVGKIAFESEALASVRLREHEARLKDAAERDAAVKEREDDEHQEAEVESKVLLAQRVRVWFSLFVSALCTVIGASVAWGMQLDAPPKTTAYLVGFVVATGFAWAFSVRPLLLSGRMPAPLRSSAPVVWGFATLFWPALVGLILCAIASNAHATWRFAAVALIGSVLFTSLGVGISSKVATALSVRAPRREGEASDSVGRRSPFIWLGLLLTVVLNVSVVVGKLGGTEMMRARDRTQSSSVTSSSTPAQAQRQGTFETEPRPVAQPVPVPAPTASLMDLAASVGRDDAAYLVSRLLMLKSSQTSACALIVNQIREERLEDFAARVAMSWSRSPQQHCNGVLIAISVDRRQSRLSWSRQSTRWLTDGEARELESAFQREASRSDVASGLRNLVNQLEKVAFKSLVAGASDQDIQTKSRSAAIDLATAVASWDGQQASPTPAAQASMDSAINRLQSMPRPARGDRPLARQLHASGMALLGQPDFALLALEKLQLAHAADPLDIQILNDLAYFEQRVGDHRSAVSHLLGTLRLAPNRTSAWLNLAESIRYLPNPGMSAQEVREFAVASYLAAYWYSGNREKTIEYLRGKTSSEDSNESRMIVLEATKRILDWQRAVLNHEMKRTVPQGSR